MVDITSMRSLYSLGSDKRLPLPLPTTEDYVVDFDGPNDLQNAQNWPTTKKLYVGGVVSFFALTASFSSSIFAPAIPVVSRDFRVSEEVATLGTSLFVLGYAFGPILWAPLSEYIGRRLPLIVSTFGFSVFSLAVATANDLQTVIICRFFGGLFGSCPLVVVAAVFADMFDHRTRGLAIAVFAILVAAGPLVAPFIGGFIVLSDLGWRWTQHIAAIMGFTSLVLQLFFLHETYAPVLLKEKAARLRYQTKNWAIHAPRDEIELDLHELVTKHVTRPLRLLFTEPIVSLVAIYMAFIYGLLYLLLTAFALVFQGVYSFNAGVGGLPYLATVLGEVVGFGVVVFQNRSYAKKLKANNSIPIPEWRLPLVAVGGIFFAVGFFWFGWTGYTGHIHWIVPTLAGLSLGFGIFTVFIGLTNYIVDSYLTYAASAVAALTFLRSLFGCIFPLFATYMFKGMGIQWASTLIGCLATVMIPLPVVFYIFGKRIREKSSFAPASDIEQDRQRGKDKRANILLSRR